MRDFFKILKRYLPPYKTTVVLNVLFNFLGALFGIFQFITLIPVLRILFNPPKEVSEYVDIPFSLKNMGDLKEALMNNLNSLIARITIENGASAALIYVGIFMVGIVIFKTSFSYLGSFFMVYIRNGVVRDIRNQIYKKSIGLPLGFYSEEKKGDIIARMTGDVNEVEISIMNSLDMFFKNPIIILVSVVTMIIMSWQLTLFVFILFPIAGYIIGRIGKSLKRRSRAGQNKMGEILSTIEETLSGLRIIKAFNAENTQYNRFSKQNEEFRHIMNRIMWRRFLAHPVSELLGTLVMVGLLWYGGSLILNEKSTLRPEAFIGYLGIFYNVINPAKAFSQAMYTIQKGMASMERIDKILSAESSITEITAPLPVSDFREKIEFRNVYFKYQKEHVLSNINLTIPKGKTIALVGMSGSGKSTLVDMIPRFYDVLEGQIFIDGQDIRHLKISDLRNLMGVVNQEPILFNDTFYNNIAFGVDNISEEAVMNAAKVAHAHEFIIQTEQGYHTNIGDRGGKMSGGQRQRISIARAVLKNPPILILDEATSALDTESEKLVQDALVNLMKNRTSIVIAHRLSTITHADEIYVMDNGYIVEHGKHEVLINKNGKYKSFYDLQNFS
ncbi:MAG: ATP-binding cassette domain-containing protein [Bacteroidetes bacterium]|jgi:subfamily B ATP-binding cassette protein MsbA|nr:ATP-binding cassette domain-containing protein [Bacteroidota bacterium]